MKKILFFFSGGNNVCLKSISPESVIERANEVPDGGVNHEQYE